jgi:hypothetical protein
MLIQIVNDTVEAVAFDRVKLEDYTKGARAVLMAQP